MWQVFRYEWRTNRRSFFIWAGIILVFQMMFAGLGDVYMTNTSLLEALKQFPPALLEGFGMHVEMFGSFEGWMAGEPLVFYMMLLGVFASMWASSTIARERDRGTVDFMFTLPVSRGKLFLGKACAHLVAFLLIAAVGYGVTLWFGSMFSTVANAGLLLVYTVAGLLAASFCWHRVCDDRICNFRASRHVAKYWDRHFIIPFPSPVGYAAIACLAV
ncbi:ABC transporter permease subunit [Paenibacillus alvei]|uniref:ABC transporter permease subunit n=1 Tax=Paenibacillus alvei TaxID=44250 RepID=UPI001F50C6B5|nr:ABC transporter permease subunit [Paenibacillus alvei]